MSSYVASVWKHRQPTMCINSYVSVARSYVADREHDSTYNYKKLLLVYQSKVTVCFILHHHGLLIL